MNTPPGTKPPPNRRVFVVSDTHFGHANICKFTSNGAKLRPWEEVSEMDRAMVENWNRVVRPSDKVYHLGDVAVPRRSLAILGSLHGDKVLIRGNHDIFHLDDYARYFRDVRSYHVLNGCVFSHVPIHQSCLERFGCNVHGHTHANVVKRPSEIGGYERDPSYLNVCVEHTGYAPIPLEEVFERVVAQGGTVGFRERRRDTEPLE